MTRLRTCEGCSRHVFATETHCPFCGAALAAVSSAPIFTLKGLSRAQRFAMVAAVAGGPLPLVACSNGPDDSGMHAGTGGSSAAGSGTAGTGTAGGTPQPVYGAPIAPDAGAGTGGGAQPVYGAPITPDAGTAGSGGSGSAGKPSPMPQPLYGAPLPAYGAPPK